MTHKQRIIMGLLKFRLYFIGFHKPHTFTPFV